MKGGNYYLNWSSKSLSGLGNASDQENEGEQLKSIHGLPSVGHPQTPREPMEFLSRSWNLSASEVSKALAHKQSNLKHDSNLSMVPEAPVVPQKLETKVLNPMSTPRKGSFGKWFLQHRVEPNTSSSTSTKRKERARSENAHLHSALSIAALAAGLASLAATVQEASGDSRMSFAMASATELLASHCAELAESAGAGRERVASVVRSAVGVRSPGDLMTLTAAAATALRGEAALKLRKPKEATRKAAISPCDRGKVEKHAGRALYCEGELMQHARKGVFQWKNITVYMNNKSQVVLKIKRKHVGGAFSKKSIVYGVCDKSSSWPYRKTKENDGEEVFFGLKTGQGLLEFKCKNKVQKQRWVNGIQSLLRKAQWVESIEFSLQLLTINGSSST